jgi:hypothetical protein
LKADAGGVHSKITHLTSVILIGGPLRQVYRRGDQNEVLRSSGAQEGVRFDFMKSLWQCQTIVQVPHGAEEDL